MGDEGVCVGGGGGGGGPCFFFTTDPKCLWLRVCVYENESRILMHFQAEPHIRILAG